MIPAVTHKLTMLDIGFIHTIWKRVGCARFCHADGNHQNKSFNSKSLVAAAAFNNNNNFPICYPGCLSIRRRHSQIRKEDHGPSIFT